MRNKTQILRHDPYLAPSAPSLDNSSHSSFLELLDEQEESQFASRFSSAAKLNAKAINTMNNRAANISKSSSLGTESTCEESRSGSFGSNSSSTSGNNSPSSRRHSPSNSSFGSSLGFSKGSNHSISGNSISGNSVARMFANAQSAFTGFTGFSDMVGYTSPPKPPKKEQQLTSVETPINKRPYVVEEQYRRETTPFDPYISKSPLKGKPGHADSSSSRHTPPAEPHYAPIVTEASIPFEKTIPPTSYLRDELYKDKAFRHSLKAGTLWQSLVGQHVKFPALWYDGQEPARPYLGCEDPLKRNKWSYFGRHRVASDPKLNALVRNPRSSGKLLLHLVLRDSDTLAPTEDICVGVFHPHAEGIYDFYNDIKAHKHVDCRDVWIGHRSRRVAVDNKRQATRIESLLRYLHKKPFDKSPLGSSSKKRTVDNTNMNAVFGSKPPRHTLFVDENKLHNLLVQKTEAPDSPPASVLLLRLFLK